VVKTCCNELQVAASSVVFEMTARPLSCELDVPDTSNCAVLRMLLCMNMLISNNQVCCTSTLSFAFLWCLAVKWCEPNCSEPAVLQKSPPSRINNIWLHGASHEVNHTVFALHCMTVLRNQGIAGLRRFSDDASMALCGGNKMCISLTWTCYCTFQCAWHVNIKEECNTNLLEF